MPQLMTPGYGTQADPQQQAFQRVIDAIRAQAPTPPYGLNLESAISEGRGSATTANTIDSGINRAGEILNDPRNAWIGLGPIAMAAKPMGWGAEVLRRYKLLGGTPETLNKTLMRSGLVHPEDRQNIVDFYRKGTDLAAPSHRPGFSLDQGSAMQVAGDVYQELGRPRPMRYGFKDNLITEYPQRTLLSKGYYTDRAGIESGASGNAAYNAVSRQVGRMLNTPSYGKSNKPNSSYWAEPGMTSDAEYYKEFPINRRSINDNREASELLLRLRNQDIHDQLQEGIAGANARPNVRRDTIRGGPPTEEDFNAARNTRQWPPPSNE